MPHRHGMGGLAVPPTNTRDWTVPEVNVTMSALLAYREDMEDRLTDGFDQWSAMSEDDVRLAIDAATCAIATLRHVQEDNVGVAPVARRWPGPGSPIYRP